MITQERRTIGAATYTMSTLVLMIGMLFVGAQQAYAQMQVDNGCMEEVASMMYGHQQTVSIGHRCSKKLHGQKDIGSIIHFLIIEYG